ncbi:hypothetical protein LGK97_14125 [Clostridium sp. CS001]|uniref:hypothetical protein n=1 Tax=Clostridium sp. CS001 TaxID=2880648 RepID=UPI001CF33BDD|nr:hypothetical protein [Clostridium sp. CS001]MCB2290880.1 hypothetical protein [Clostridium sp. CS001]
MKESIEKYNMWIYSLSKSKYVFVVFITCILEALALSVIPSIINENYSHTFVKFIVIFIVISLINFPVHISQYKKNH